jgi:hypothetical protein
MTTLGLTVPYYGGRQSQNPSTVYSGESTPSTSIKANIGDLYVNETANTAYICTGRPAGVTTWTIIT